LVIVEEIQDFGNTIPYGFLKRSPSPDLLVFTPAPQPIHVLETVYSDFALSTVSDDEQVLPVSHWVKAKEREQTYAKLHKLIEEGRQGLIIWPVVNGKDSIDVKQALQMAGAIQGRYLPDVRIAVYCSSMRKDERLKVFEEFQNKRIDVLLCTTIIEDTPSVGNTTMIIVEKAEVSDVMRLHRLRGHLSSSHYPSFCTYVVSDEASENSIDLVQQVCDEPNGFALAEWLADDTDGLKLRWADQDEVKVRGEARQMAHFLSLKELRRCRWPLLNNAVRNWWSEFDIPEQKAPNRKRKRYKRRR
jgi:ATP-dependent DNA helicase RecG